MQGTARQVQGLIVASVALVAVVVLAAPGTAWFADLASSPPVEVEVKSPPAFPSDEISRQGLLSGLEEVDDVIAEALQRAEAAVDAARRQAEEARTEAGGETEATSRTGASAASATSSSSSEVNVSNSVSGGGSVSSSVSVSNSSSSVASSGGSTVVSGSSSSNVSSSQDSSGEGSTCISEVITSTEVNGVAESSRQVSDSC